MEIITYKNFSGSVEVSLKDKCLHGKILFIDDLVTYEAEDFDSVKKEFRNAVDDYLQTCEMLQIEPFKSYSGTFNVRIGSELHQELAAYAITNDKKTNAVVKEAIQEYLKNCSSSRNHTSIQGS